MSRPIIAIAGRRFGKTRIQALTVETMLQLGKTVLNAAGEHVVETGLSDADKEMIRRRLRGLSIGPRRREAQKLRP